MVTVMMMLLTIVMLLFRLKLLIYCFSKETLQIVLFSDSRFTSSSPKTGEMILAASVTT